MLTMKLFLLDSAESKSLQLDKYESTYAVWNTLILNMTCSVAIIDG